MSVNVETAIKYMESLKARNIKYSMTGSRTGSDGTGDCSGTIYQGLRNGGMPDAGWVLNTDSMHNWLEKNNWKQIANQSKWTAKRGDITIFGKRGASGGAAGHVVLWISNTQFIHCTWNSDWDHGVRIDYETNKMFLYDMMWYTYRYQGTTPTKPVASENNSLNNYHTTGTRFEALKDLEVMADEKWTKKTGVTVHAGKQFDIDKIVNTGRTTHGKLSANFGYISLYKQYVKKIE